MQTWQEMGFRWLRTEDGSPTLGGIEAMHHSGGALAETLLVYGQPLKLIFSRLEKPRLLSLGLGLGYVEWTIAAEALRQNKSFEILTLESVAPLVQAFCAHLREERLADEVHGGLEEVAARVAAAHGVTFHELKNKMQQALLQEQWRWGGVLAPENLPRKKFHGILYDAFSAKTDPGLWTEDFLRNFLENCAEEDCVFTTYACTGNLKRALRACGFEVVRRPGFSGRKHSILAIRGPRFSVLPDSGIC